MFKRILARFRWVADNATLATLYKVVALDTAIALVLVGIALVLVSHHHTLIATPFQLVSAFEGLCVGVGLRLIWKRHTTARS